MLLSSLLALVVFIKSHIITIALFQMSSCVNTDMALCQCIENNQHKFVVTSVPVQNDKGCQRVNLLPTHTSDTVCNITNYNLWICYEHFPIGFVLFI